jgi:hypothetical protein
MTNSLKNYFSLVYNNLGKMQHCMLKYKKLEEVYCGFVYNSLKNE